MLICVNPEFDFRLPESIKKSNFARCGMGVLNSYFLKRQGDING